MAQILKPSSSLLNDYKIGSSLSGIIKIQEQIASAFRSTDYFQKENISSFMKIQESIASIKSLTDSVGSFHDITHSHSYINFVNDALKNIEPSFFENEEIFGKEFEKEIESLDHNGKKILNEASIALCKLIPEFNNIKEAYKNKKNIQLFIYILFFFLMYFHNELYLMISPPIESYKINRDNVRIRTEPSTDNPSSIMAKINKNIVVEKIDTKKNWVKIKFENSQGEEIEGWVRNDMLKKID